jgi:RNA recognition motif-containing protein
MQNKLYVGGIPYSTTQDELKTAFAQAGSVTSATIITDKMTGRSRGFGFVEMASADEANRAIEMWNGKELGGRTLLVSLARPQERNDRFSR